MDNKIPEIRELRTKLGVSQRLVAKIIRCSRVTLARWELGEQKPLEIYEREIKRALRELNRLAASLQKIDL